LKKKDKAESDAVAMANALQESNATPPATSEPVMSQQLTVVPSLDDELLKETSDAETFLIPEVCCF
jgi:hypothetical protein